MDLKQQISQDLKEAMKGREELTSSVLRMVLAAFLNKEKDKRYKLSKQSPDMKEEDLTKESALSDDEITEALSSEVKKRREAASEYDKGNRPELAEKERNEIEILQKYLPEQLSEDEVRKLVQDAVQKTGAKEQKDMGKVMGVLMPQVKGKADGNMVSKIVKESLTPQQ